MGWIANCPNSCPNMNSEGPGEWKLVAHKSVSSTTQASNSQTPLT
jgi:hypothetical protein